MNSNDNVIDVRGEHSGGALSKRMIIAVVGTVLIYFLLSLIDLSAYGENCSKALGFVAATIFWMIASPLEMSVAAFLIVALGVFTGVFTPADVSSKLGSSSFYSMLGMTIVAGGISYTKFGERLSYWMLYKFGQKPVKMVVIVGVMTAVLSSCVSNIATIILVSSICNSLLLNMGEKPGESKLGKALMSIVPMAALLGGYALINGSPIGNLNGIAYLNAASGDLNLTVSYTDWAKISVPSFLIIVVPCMLIYVLTFKVKNKDFKCPPPSYYKEQLDKLGKMGGSEIRWLLIVVLMVGTMLSGMNTSISALFFAGLCMLPGIGIVDAKSCIKSQPWGVLICVCMCPLIGTAITNNGVSDLLSHYIKPLLEGIGPLPLSMLSMFLLFLAMNLMVNATHGAHALVISLCVPICISLGYNPCTVLLPTLFAGGFFWCIGANYIVMMNKGYGWWDMKDPILPGFLTGCFLCIAIPVINYILVPLWGMSFYL